MRPFAALSILLVSIASATADLTVVQKTEGALNSGELTLRIKGDKARTDIAPQITMLTELTTGDSTTLNHNARTYMRIPGTEAAKLRSMAAELKPGTSAEPPKLVATGKKEKVEGRECEIYTWSVGKIEVTDSDLSEITPTGRLTWPSWCGFRTPDLEPSAQPLMPPLEKFPGMVIKREMSFKGTKTISTLLSASDAVLEMRNSSISPKATRNSPPPKLPEENVPAAANK